LAAPKLGDYLVSYEQGTGRLILEMRRLGTPRFAFDPWDQGLGIYCSRRGRWAPTDMDPGFNLLQPGRSLQPQNPLAPFNRTIPARLVEVIERFKIRQHWVMRLLRRNPDSEHMARHNPVLLALVAKWAHIHGCGDLVVDRLLLEKRENVLRRVTGWGQKRQVRLLAKLKLRRITEPVLRWVDKLLLREPVARYLSRFKVVTMSMLYYALSAEEFLGCRLLAKASHDPRKAARALRSVAFWASPAIDYGKAVFEPDTEELVRQCQSVGQLRRLHDQWQEAYEISRLAGLEALFNEGVFPDPPFPGSETIVPIRSVKELVEEGWGLYGHFGSYSSHVFQGSL